ncbi:DsbA family protein [Salibacteraceae bacterium]|nr:DsbA family protein [Salibacteraceae bacterium]
MSYSWLNAQNPTIIYIGDPMCSWCYGFAPEITELKEALPNYEFKLVLGGLRPGGTETNEDLGEFLAHHWKDVEERTGQPFNYDVLKDSNLVYDTEPACRAVVVARSMNPEIELDFFKAVQSSFYVDAKDIRDTETYVSLAKQFKLDEGKFRTEFESEEMKYATKADFQLSSEMGIRGFPSVVMSHNEQLYMIANGFTTSKELMKTIEKIKSE